MQQSWLRDSRKFRLVADYFFQLNKEYLYRSLCPFLTKGLGAAATWEAVGQARAAACWF